MEIKCTSKLKAENPNEDVFGLYDIIELDFEISEPLHETAFFCAHFQDEWVYVYREDLNVDGTTFKITANANFLDLMKDLHSSITNGESSTIKFSYQLECSAGHIHHSQELQNPWFE